MKPGSATSASKRNSCTIQFLKVPRPGPSRASCRILPLPETNSPAPPRSMLLPKRSFLLLLMALSPAVLGQNEPTQEKPHSKPEALNPAAFENDIKAFEDLDKVSPPPRKAILFVGDSTFTRWKTIHEDLNEYRVINRGFGGSQMSDVLLYVDRIVLPYKPRLIVVQEGGNDIHSGKTPEQFLAEVKEFVEKVHSTLPDVPIVFGCITPNIARWNELEIRKRTNLLVQNYLAGQKNVRYIDCFDAFLGNDGLPNHELFVADGLHSSPAGYKLRANILRPFLGAPDNPKK